MRVINRIIVTGANGFLGTALCKKMADNGVFVYAIVKPGSEYDKEFDQNEHISVFFCDMADYNSLDNIITDRGFDIMYHLAWKGSSGILRGDYRLQISNIQNSAEAVEVCEKLGCKRFVFAASIMEYEIEAIINADKKSGISTIYSSSKKAADYICRSVADSKGVEYIRLLISNVFGPGERSERLINSTIRKILNGEHCSFSSGDQMYDFIYIDDAIEEFIAVGKSGKHNKTYYIGTLEPKPLKEFLISLRDQINPSIELGIGDIPFDGVSLTYKEFDVNSVSKDTGYKPKVQFDEGIKRTIDDFVENMKNV